jgi:hypothetical protein
MRTSKVVQTLCVGMSVCAFTILAVSSALSAQSDPSVGTWKLNAAKSKYSLGPMPKEQTVTIEAAGDETKVTVKGIGADGSPIDLSYSYKLDGKDYPMSGSQDFDSVALKRNGTTVEGVRKKAGKQVQTYSRVVSKDGKTMTVMVKGTNAKGQTINNVSVYEKQ